jgi:hypothetical protein
MKESEFLQKCEEVGMQLAHVHDAKRKSPASFFGPIDEVGRLEREFVRSVAEGTLDTKVVVVASRLHMLGKQADALLAE